MMGMGGGCMSTVRSMMGEGMMGMMGTKCADARSRERNLNLRGGVPIDFDEVKAPPLPASYSYNPSLSNVDWKDFDLEQFSNALQCDNLPSDRPIHDVDTWHQLRQTYEDVVGPQRSSISRVLTKVEGKRNQQPDMPVAALDSNTLRVDRFPGKGRGIVASKDIKKGEKMWSDVYVGKHHFIHNICVYTKSY